MARGGGHKVNTIRWTLVIIVCVIMIVIAVTPIWRTDRESTTRSCAAAFAASITNEEVLQLNEGRNGWRVLGASEVDQLTSKRGMFDCSVPLWRMLASARKAGPFLDPWNQ